MSDRINGDCKHPKSMRVAWKSDPDDLKPHVDAFLCTACGRTIKAEITTLVDRLRKEVSALAGINSTG